MEQTREQVFGALAAKVLHETFSFGTLVSGFAVGIAVITTQWILNQAGATGVTPVAVQILLALAVGRYALNGLHGELGGTVFSGFGGSWLECSSIAFRYVLLSTLWLVPMALLKIDPLRAGELLGATMMGMAPRGILMLFALYAAASILTPPIFLVVSVSALRFSDLFSPGHWVRSFSGRRNDLILIYTLYLGAVLGIFVLAFPVIVALGALHQGLAMFGGACTAAYALGAGLSLLGRLTGFFAALGEMDSNPEALAAVLAESSQEADRMPTIAPFQGTPSLSVVEGGVVSGKPPLLDPRAEVQAAVGKFDSDPEAALTELRRLREDHVPHPLVLHALCLLLKKHNQTDASLEVAREAIPVFFLRGNVRLAAEVVHMHLDRVSDLELRQDELFQVAAQLRQIDQIGTATRVYAMILDSNPYETKAIKGLLQVAEHHLTVQDPSEAKRVYEYLLDTASNSPLADFMRQGLENAERKIAG